MPIGARSDGLSSHRRVHSGSVGSSELRTRASRNDNRPNQLLQPGDGKFVPVASFQASDMVVLRAMLDSRHVRNMTCEDVLDSLDGVNNHTAEQWTRYLLRNIHSIELVDPPLGESTHVEPSSTSFLYPVSASSISGPSESFTPVGRNLSVTRMQSSTRGAPPIFVPEVNANHDSPPRGRPRNSTSRVSDDHNNDRGTPLVEVTDLESPLASRHARSPTPPRRIQKFSDNRYRYTDEDMAYFVKMGRHMVRQDPNVSLDRILLRVTEKAPHHNLRSWQQHLKKHPGLVQRMRSGANPMIKPYFTREDEEAQLEVGPNAARNRSETMTEDDGIIRDLVEDAPGDATDDENNLGDLGSSYKPVEERVLARYIALHRHDWSHRSMRENINHFHQEYRWSRTEIAWFEFYRKNREAIDNLASRLRLQPRSKPNSRRRAGQNSPSIIIDMIQDSSSSSPLDSHNQKEPTQNESPRKVVRRTAAANATPSDDVRQGILKRKEPDSGFDSSRGENDMSSGRLAEDTGSSWLSLAMGATKSFLVPK
ncbi:hypothetical protein BDY19DRAFT_914612 [Irpex rosettiformis]|uniref:Uncharacterized protein n=1 Tax=Irpex rosettiformis TaxID=378272 RepID=A0ACB8UKC7_9APHY|nr:hypothetical protein BDY19DRAFT_914612 [Irpex rosettiformis]